MVQTSAGRQKRYRQRVALAQLRNGYSVTLMVKACKAAKIDVWSVITECAEMVFDNGGDGLEFVKRIVPLVYAVACTTIILNKLELPA